MVARIALCAGVLVSILGCRANPARMDENGRILFEDNNLRRLIAIEGQQSSRADGDLLRVCTEIKNNSKRDLWVDWQMVWKDGQGHEMYKTNWAPLLLTGRFVTTHEVTSMTADVQDYELRLRTPAKTIEAD